MKAAVFGGAFNPVHLGHLRLSKEFGQRLGLDKILLIPSSAPPHKPDADMAPAADRLEMCRLSVGEDSLFTVSDIEIKRGGVSFTADTLERLVQIYPDTEWYLITGADMFLTLGTWHRFDDIARIAVLCAAPRDGGDSACLREYAAKLEKRGARCIIEDIPMTDISSTQIRQRIKQGKSIDGLTSPAVVKYISDKSLYRKASTDSVADERLIEIVRGRLTPQRFEHSKAVAKQAVHLATIYGADTQKAYTAGILHDIMKDTDKDTLLQMMGDFGIILDNAQTASPSCWHAVAGSAFIENILHIDDRDIINAVRYHTTARAGMSPLEKTIYLADLTSSDRNYADILEMRRLAELGSEQAMEYALSYTIRYLESKRAVILPDAVHAYNEIIASKGGYKNAEKQPKSDK